MSQLVNAEVNSGNSSTSNYTLQLRIRECHAGMKCELKVTKHYLHCVDPENIHSPPPSHGWFFTLDPPTPPLGISIAEGLWTPPPPSPPHVSFSPKSTASANLPRKHRYEQVVHWIYDAGFKFIKKNLKDFENPVEKLTPKKATLLAGWFVDSFSVRGFTFLYSSWMKWIRERKQVSVKRFHVSFLSNKHHYFMSDEIQSRPKFA